MALAIVRALARYERVGATAKQLALDVGIPARSVQRRIASLVREGVIERLSRTHVRYDPRALDVTADPNGREGVHGLVLTSFGWREDPLRPSGATALFGERGDEERPHPRYREAHRSFNGRLVTLRLFDTGTLWVSFPSTRRPIGWWESREIVGWLNGLLGVDDAGARFRVSEIGVHVDHPTLRVKGWKAVSLEDGLGLLQQFYEKKSALRHEFHLWGKRLRRLDLAGVVRILTEGSPEAQIERALLHELDLAHLGKRTRKKMPGDPEPPPPIRPDSQSGYG